MYFDLEDRRPDTPLLDRPLTRLEQVLLTIIAYLLVVIGMIVYPRLPCVRAAEAARLEKLQEQQKQRDALQDHMQYAFAMPKVEIQRMPQRPKVLSDESHTAQSRERPRVPKNDTPFTRGNTADLNIASPAPREEPRPEPTAPAASNPN